MFNELEGPITHEELHQEVINSKNNKSPGPNGFPVEFYKKIWDHIAYLYLRSINSNFKNSKISNSQLQGVITCIPKGNKPRKLISTCISNRVKKVLDILIGQQQKGFIQGRNISECTREIYDFIISSTVILAADWSIAVGYWIVFHCFSLNGNVRIRISVLSPLSMFYPTSPWQLWV